jgi:NAD+ synthase (glutamine-hydrolysing)
MRIGIGQINVHVGAIEENTEKILRRVEEARVRGCDLVVFPEMAVCGPGAGDLLRQRGFLAACDRAVAQVQQASQDLGVVVGAPGRGEPPSSAGALSNRAFFFSNRTLLGTADKHALSIDEVPGEARYFAPGEGSTVHAFRGHTVGVQLGKDPWIEDGPTELQASLGAEWIVNPCAAPFVVGGRAADHRSAVRRTRENGAGLLRVNLVGGQDEVVFDGGSTIYNADGQCVFRAPRFAEGLYVVDVDHASPVDAPSTSEIQDVRDALVLGVRDYARKNGFCRLLLGLSGGIDSAVVTALAADAVGADNVHCVYLPSEFSSQASREDARATASALGVAFEEIAITQIHEALRRSLPDSPDGLVDENLQPRIRATVLMALSNQSGALVLCPGNKSEIAMGYNTLYGDTVGGLAPIADLYKEQVYSLAALYGDLLPARVLSKPPSAELRPGQRDEDDLPAYRLLDPVLREFLEEGATVAELQARGHDGQMVKDVARRIRQSEYKRAQLPPGIRVSRHAFGSGRWFPRTHGYEE